MSVSTRFIEPFADRVSGRLRQRRKQRGNAGPLHKRVDVTNVDTALRYSAVIDLIEPFLGRDPRIAEIGSGAAGITAFLDLPVTGVDTAFERTEPLATPYLTRVEASAAELPFEDASFDVVLSLEMLEHIPPDARRKVLSEMFRVLRPGGRMVVSFPADAPARELDLKLNAAYRARYGNDHPWVAEHISEGVPSTPEVVALMESIGGDEATVTTHKHDPARSWLLHQSLYSARRWYVAALLTGLHSRLGARAVFALARRMRGGDHYRTILVVDRS